MPVAKWRIRPVEYWGDMFLVEEYVQGWFCNRWITVKFVSSLKSAEKLVAHLRTPVKYYAETGDK